MPTRDDRLHQLLAKSSGNKTFTIPGHKKNKLRNVPKRKAKQQSFRSSNNNNHPQQSGLLSINALRQHTTGQSIPPLNLTQTRNRQRRRRTSKKKNYLIFQSTFDGRLLSSGRWTFHVETSR